MDNLERFLGAMVGDGGEGVCFLEVVRDGQRLRVVAKLHKDGSMGAVLLGRVDARGHLHSVKMQPFALTASEEGEAMDRIEAMAADVAHRARRAGL